MSRRGHRNPKQFALVLFGLASLFLLGAEARRVCRSFLQCAPLILAVPLREIVDASKYYSKTLLVVSEISEEEWEEHIKLLEHLCHTWISFDNCMERNWLECVDWDQMVNFLDIMAGRVERVGVAGAAIDHGAVEGAKTQFRQEHWTAESFRDAMDVATISCRNIGRITPYMKCGRDLVMANETLLNITLRWRALTEAMCYKGTRRDCDKVETMMKLMGHWLYHSCRNMTEELTDIVQLIFTGIIGHRLEQCAHIVVNKTARELFEKPPPPELFENFGDDLSGCNMESVEYHHRSMYNGTVTMYLRNHNMTKPQFFDMMQRRLQRSGGRVPGAPPPSSPSPPPPPAQVVYESEPVEETTTLRTTKRATNRYGKRRRWRTTTPPFFYEYDLSETNSAVVVGRWPSLASLVVAICLALPALVRNNS